MTDALFSPDLDLLFIRLCDEAIASLAPLSSPGPGPTDAPSPIEHLPPLRFPRPLRRIAVTDISSTLHCEAQMLLEKVTHHRRTTTPAMAAGKHIHRNLELAVNGPELAIPITSTEDIWALRFVNAILAIKSLVRDGIAREVPVLGRLGPLLVYGIIDEVHRKPDHSFHVRDTKTRVRRSLPPEESQRPSRLQVAVYRRFFMEMARLDRDFVLERLDLDPQKELGSAVVEQLLIMGLSLGVATRPLSPISPNDGPPRAHFPPTCPDTWTIAELFRVTTSYFGMIPSISPLLELSYVHQYSGDVIGTVEFDYDEVDLNNMLSRTSSLFTGQREAVGVEVDEAYKCRGCDYAEQCRWRIERADGPIN
ncbi:hypothetical protein SeLEV6574_g05715 [Synchytrium endobioticum]|uniref:Exonuclease V n=1 Tax=Synchytrium endobioticum TaxID=286115 RepID=A0A507CST7_9FUNG|nr:hypothetical protein SeLEV6574_g05715 [Synchytrium endobioticum]